MDTSEKNNSMKVPADKDFTIPPSVGNFQVDISSTDFDLENITSSYTGFARIYRLIFIAQHCSSLRHEALLAALGYLKETHCCSIYKKILDELAAENVSLPPSVETSWVEKTTHNFNQKLEKLDHDLRNFRTHAIKDSIRHGHDDLGDHYFDNGDFLNAIRCYVRSRDYCTNSKHVLAMYMNVIKASFYLQNWSNVLSYITKAEQTIEAPTATPQTSMTALSLNSGNLSAYEQSNEVVSSRLKAYAGIGELATGRYKAAARHFVGITFLHCSTFFQDLISPQTLVHYVCLCALATFERREIHRLILTSKNMKEFLDTEPLVAEILYKYYEASYSACLTSLTKLKPLFLLDQHLAPHVPALYHDIRHGIIITYFSPYKSASMITMARQLNSSIEILEDELVTLIRSGKIQARIDSKNKVLFLADTDQRWCAYQQALNATKASENLTRSLLLRSAIIKADLSVQDNSSYRLGSKSYNTYRQENLIDGNQSDDRIMD